MKKKKVRNFTFGKIDSHPEFEKLFKNEIANVFRKTSTKQK